MRRPSTAAALLLALGASSLDAAALEPALQTAILQDDLLAVRRLVTSWNVDAQIQPPQYADTPLALASYFGRAAIVRFLVEERKADLYRTYAGAGLSSRLAGEAAVHAPENPANRKTAAYLLPRHDFYQDYLARLKAAGPYGASSFLWPEGARVLFLGEKHGVREFPGEAAKLVESLPVTHYATEFLAQADQPLIDAYEAGTKSEEDFKAGVARDDSLPPAFAAKRKGAKIVGLEKFPELPDKTQAMTIDITAERNKNWLVPIMDILDNFPDAKLLVYCGSDHSNYGIKSKPISELVAEKIGADKVFVARLAGGHRNNPPEEYDLPTYMADKAGRSGEDFIARALGASPALRAAVASDAIIHLKRESVLAGAEDE